jgi:hypothetical protein
MDAVRQQLIELNLHCRADLVSQLAAMTYTGERDLNHLTLRDTTAETRTQLKTYIADLDQLIANIRRGII